MLLSNFILSINLMKSIAIKFSNAPTFEASHQQQLETLKGVEATLNGSGKDH